MSKFNENTFILGSFLCIIHSFTHREHLDRMYIKKSREPTLLVTPELEDRPRCGNSECDLLLPEISSIPRIQAYVCGDFFCNI